jgi:OFA family oxalate/formate antiporter-like MFS transporter
VLVGRYYGSARSSENYAALYTAKLWGGIGGGVVASLVIATVGWNFTFLGGAVLVALAGLSLRSLRPVER